MGTVTSSSSDRRLGLAVAPARRATRLNVVDALAFE